VAAGVSGSDSGKVERPGMVPEPQSPLEMRRRPSLGQLGEQRQAGGEDEKALLALALLQPECGAQRSRLRRRQLADEPERGPHQLVQRAERQLGLGLHAACGDDVHVGGQIARVFEQRRLADAGLPAQHEHALRDARASSRRTRIASRSASRP